MAALFLLLLPCTMMLSGCSSCGDNTNPIEPSLPQGGAASGGEAGSPSAGGQGGKPEQAGAGGAAGKIDPGNPGGAAAQGGESGQGGGAGNPIVGDSPSQGAPEKVSSSYGCTWPGCTDAARACDDYLRAGCGKTFGYNGSSPGLGAPDQIYKDSLGACTAWIALSVKEKTGEKASELQDEGKDISKIAEADLVAVATMARCMRQARSCEEMLYCLRGGMVFSGLDSYFPLPPPEPAAPPPEPPPFWKQPFRGGADPWMDPPPWGGEIAMMPVDSPSCTACAVQRCPDFAYLCFGALGKEEDCPGGNCCQGLRQCIHDCGGYEPFTTMLRFDLCMHRCKEKHPLGVQQLVDLQHCGDVACQGCEALDQLGQEGTP